MDVETNRATDRGCASVKDFGGNRGAVAYRRQATARVEVHFPVPRIVEQIVEVIEVILQERMRLSTFERRVVVQQLLTGVFGGLWSAWKSTSDSTGGRAHNPPPLCLDDRGGWREVRTRVW